MIIIIAIAIAIIKLKISQNFKRIQMILEILNYNLINQLKMKNKKFNKNK